MLTYISITRILSPKMRQISAPPFLSKFFTPLGLKIGLRMYQNLKIMHSRRSLIDICHVTDLLFVCAEHLSELILVFDGLDECEEQGSQRKMLRFLNAVQHRTRIKAFVTSRDYVLADSFTVHGNAKTSIEAHEEDLRLYVREKLEYKPICEALKKEIEEVLIRNAHGM